MNKDQVQSGAYELFMLVLCVFVLGLMGAEAILQVGPSTRKILSYVDTGICFIFLGDFAVRLITAKSKLHYLKWGWIDLISSIPFLGPLRWGRLARIVRILRLLRGVRSLKVLMAYVLRQRAQASFLAATLTSILLVTFSSISILTLETLPESNIKGPEEALWWSIVTITTVGYGDFAPVSTAGRILAAALMIAGVGLFGTFTAFIASWFMSPGEEEQEDELEQIRKELHQIRKLLAQR